MKLPDEVQNTRYNIQDTTEDIGDSLKDKAHDVKERFEGDGNNDEEQAA
jgi:hypothetical protein